MDEGLKPIDEQADHNYDTKTVVWHNSPARLTIMITRFEADDGDPLGIEGFRGEYLIFTVITGGVKEASHDPYKLSSTNGDSDLLGFLGDIRVGVKSGGNRGISWEQVQDGFKYTPSFVDGMS